MRNRTQYLTVLQFDLCCVQGDKLDHYRKGAVPEQQMFPISYVKGCKNIHQYTPGTGELVLVGLKIGLKTKIVSFELFLITNNTKLAFLLLLSFYFLC